MIESGEIAPGRGKPQQRLVIPVEQKGLAQGEERMQLLVERTTRVVPSQGRRLSPADPVGDRQLKVVGRVSNPETVEMELTRDPDVGA